MRADSIPWWRAAAGTIVLVLLAMVLAGPRTTVELLPADPSLAPALPEAGGDPPGDDVPLSRYPHLSTRPLFSGDRRLHPFFLDTRDSAAAQAADFTFMLTGLLRTPDLQIAIIRRNSASDSVSVRLGDEVPQAPGWRLVELQPRAAVFAGSHGRKLLELQTFDGAGGYAARPAVTAPVPDLPVASAASGRPPPAATRAQPRGQQSETLRNRIEARRAALRAEAAAHQR